MSVKESRSAELPHQPAQQDHLKDQQKGEAEAEIPVLGLVAEGPHPQDTAQGAPQDGGEKQGLFRNAPPAPSGPTLVQLHDQKRGRVDRQQIQPQQLPQFFGHRITSSAVKFVPVYSTGEEKTRKIGFPETFMEISWTFWFPHGKI